MGARQAGLLTSSKSSYLLSRVSYKRISSKTPRILLFVFNRLRALSFSVSRKSFACHSYENCRVYTNNSHFETQSPPLAAHQPRVVSHESPVTSHQSLADRIWAAAIPGAPNV